MNEDTLVPGRVGAGAPGIQVRSDGWLSIWVTPKPPSWLLSTQLPGALVLQSRKPRGGRKEARHVEKKLEGTWVAHGETVIWGRKHMDGAKYL